MKTLVILVNEQVWEDLHAIFHHRGSTPEEFARQYLMGYRDGYKAAWDETGRDWPPPCPSFSEGSNGL